MRGWGQECNACLISVIVALLHLCCAGCSDEPPRKETMDLRSGPPVEIKIRNYLGNTQNIHPKVLHFDEPWNGYNYWMAYTPYPNGSVSAENPCIAVSNDGLKWETPKGLVNPLFNNFPGGYNSDTHLVYRESDGVLECWWRCHIIDIKSDLICRRTSKDGVIWTPPETVVQLGERRKLRLSPAVFIKEGRYTMFYSTGRYIYETHCDVQGQRFEWSEPVLVPIPQGDLGLWHLDVIPDRKNCLDFVICAYEPGCNNNSADLYYVRGNSDTWEFSEPVKMISRSNSSSAFDCKSIYRASVLKDDSCFVVYYSSIDNKNRRHLALQHIEFSPF